MDQPNRKGLVVPTVVLGVLFLFNLISTIFNLLGADYNSGFAYVIFAIVLGIPLSICLYKLVLSYLKPGVNIVMKVLIYLIILAVLFAYSWGRLLMM